MGLEQYPWALGGAILAGAALAGLVAHALLMALLKPIVRRTSWGVDGRILDHARRPTRLLFPLLAAQAALPQARERAGWSGALTGHLLSLLLIGACAWLAIGVLRAAAEEVQATHRIDVSDNLEARRLRTQTVVLQRVLSTFVIVVALGVALTTFPLARQVGASVLASAGIAGLAVGIAARPVLENLIGGLQLALSQPVRLDDVVVVEGEWGRIEEITATYVVVRIWDERRLVLPFSKFISEPFQNWTRESADILGTVIVHADYAVPVQAVRDHLQSFVEQDEEWDGRVCGLQVTGATEHTVELRALVSAADAGKAWNLRCRVREELIGFLQREHAAALPRTRVALQQQA